jgi:hypothetical protein
MTHRGAAPAINSLPSPGRALMIGAVILLLVVRLVRGRR